VTRFAKTLSAMRTVRRIGPPRVAQSTSPLGLDAEIARLATRQGGVASRAQLERLGLSKSGVSARIARGVLHPVHRGVYAVGHPVVPAQGREHAAVLACGPGTTRSHRSAGRSWDLRAWSGVVEVTAGPGRRSRPGILVHRHRLDARDVVVRDGLPVTTLARTLFDLAEVLTLEQWGRAWETAERMGALDVRALRDVARRSPGRRALALVLPRLGAPHLPGAEATRSPLEVDFLRWAAERLAAFPPPQVNARVLGYEVDAHWPQARVVVELDSVAHHLDPVAFERDRAKWAALTASGEAVFAVTARRLRNRPALVAEELTRALSARWEAAGEGCGA
jgi:very-short-patch-repair endonuclease